MILIFSSSCDATADYMVSKLKQDEIRYFRLDTDHLIDNATLLYKNGDFLLDICDQTLRPQEIEAVWYRRPRTLTSERGKFFEKGVRDHTISEWSAAIEGFLAHVPVEFWINHPSNNALAMLKLEQLSRARKIGLNVPKTLLTQCFQEAMVFWKDCGGSLVVKPISHGYIERHDPDSDTLIFTNEVMLNQLVENQDFLSLCPTLFQIKVEKAFDVRINVIDSKVISVGIHASKEDELQAVDIRRNNMKNVRYEPIELPKSVKEKILKLCRSYKLRFASVDMALTKDSNWIFFEINPNGQWAWLDLEGVTDIASSLINSMRVKPN
ncbi:MAG: MvdC/MvdD family ATP grasp protein [Cyanobacteria bacterium P01_D01_bin.44]